MRSGGPQARLFSFKRAHTYDMSLLKECIKGLIVEAWYDEQYYEATAENLMLDEPGMIVEPEVRLAVFKYLKKMGLARGRDPRPKSTTKKAFKA